MRYQSFSLLEQIIKSIRDFFSSRGFREVIIPVFNRVLPMEPNIYAFKIGDYYLPTSPEATLKKMIARGIGNCFAIGHTFRDLERSSPIHKPEFFMLEWYKEDADYKKIMEECEELILFCYKVILANRPQAVRPESRSWTSQDDLMLTKWPVISMVDLFKKYAKLDLEELYHSGFDPESKGIPHQVRDDILNRIAERGYNTKNASWEQIFNQIFLSEVEIHLPKDPFFLTDYPAKISPLCAKSRDKPYLAERFELYINRVEIGNGNTENTDANEVLKAMREEEKYRKKKGLICPPIDMEFIDALKTMHGKSYAGTGLGIERLAMVLSGVKDIGELETSSRT